MSVAVHTDQRYLMRLSALSVPVLLPDLPMGPVLSDLSVPVSFVPGLLSQQRQAVVIQL